MLKRLLSDNQYCQKYIILDLVIDLTIYFPYNMHKHITEYFSTPIGPEKTHEDIFFLIIIHRYAGIKLGHNYQAYFYFHKYNF